MRLAGDAAGFLDLAEGEPAVFPGEPARPEASD
jgi:hypothetical protein